MTFRVFFCLRWKAAQGASYAKYIEARSWTMQRYWDDLKRLAQQELTLSIFHTIRSLIRLVFITSHLVYYSTMTSLDL